MEKVREFIGSYAPLNDEEWNILLSKTTIYRLKAGEHLLAEGKICQFMGFIESGILRTYYIDKSGKEQSIFFHFEKMPISDFASYVRKTPTQCNIQCLTDAVIYTINYEDREYLMDNYPKFERIIRKMAERFYLYISDRLKDFIFLSAEERYLKLIEKKPDIFQKLPLGYISEYINIKPQSLSRIRKKLSKGIN